MKIAYIDCLSGISGDMTLGALVDAGVELSAINSGIESLGIFADNDPVGIRAARDCLARWQRAEREVVAVAPAEPGADLNDVVRGAHERTAA